MPPIQAAKLEHRAIKEGWAGTGPWPLDLKPSEFARIETEQDGELTLKQRLTQSVFNGLKSGDKRLEQLAVRSGVTMHGQNQLAEHHKERMDQQERALAARAAGRSGNMNSNVVNGGRSGVVIVIPHNNREPPPANAVPEGLMIEGTTEPCVET